MAKQLTSWTGRKGGCIHNKWSVWMQGGVWELQRGIDFSGSTAGFRCRVYGKAAEVGLRARTSGRGDTLTIEFLDKLGRSLKSSPPEATAPAVTIPETTKVAAVPAEPTVNVSVVTSAIAPGSNGPSRLSRLIGKVAAMAGPTTWPACGYMG